MAFSRIKEYYRPESGREVVELLGKYGDTALILGGGTFLHGLAARGLLPKVDALIDLQKVGLGFVKSEGDTLAIGATTTFAELGEADQVKNKPELGAVKDALQYPPAQISNMATIGGCVASAFTLFDLPVAFMALDGSVTALGAGGSREIGLHKFFLDYFEHALEKGEFLTQVRLPRLPPGSASAFLKLETNANDLALINVGVRVTVDDSKVCREARVVVGGGVGKIPVRAVSCEDVLKGQRPNQALCNESADVVSFDLHPVSDHRASAQYRTAVAKVYVRRALSRAFARLGLELG
jgi:CO/xanthine dehydrogenase FAD-binding subunit